MKKDKNIDYRTGLILRTLIDGHIKTAEPVGSRTLSKKLDEKFSPATIRNILADLEEMGYLEQPHVSAGRIPTDEGFRYYIDYLLQTEILPQKQRRWIARHFQGKPGDMVSMMRQASTLLSLITHYTGLVTAPRFDNLILKHIEFVPLPNDKILVVFVSQNGMVENKIIPNEDGLNQGELQKITSRLNEMIEGMTIAEIRARLLQEMEDDRNKIDKMLWQMLKLGQQAIAKRTENDIYVDGTFKILEHQDFSNLDDVKSILMALEEKNSIINLLDKIITTGGVQVFIGSETNVSELAGLSLIAAGYSCGGRVLGTLGVIGPTRMDYSRIIPIVDYTAKSLGRLFQ